MAEAGKGSSPPAFEELVLATRNEHKLREFREAMSGIAILPLPDEVELPPETGETFAENSIAKARAAFAATGKASLADDSGIEAKALDGVPGVKSARYAGEDATDEENLAKLLEALEGEEDRSVEYVCALSLVGPDGFTIEVEGRCSGELTDRPRGTGGFGYDPAFVPVDGPDGLTMAELPADRKHAIGHRGLAIAAMLDRLAGEASE